MNDLLSKFTPSLLGKLLFASAMSSVQLGILCLVLTPTVAFNKPAAWLSVALVFVGIMLFMRTAGAPRNA